MILWLWCCCMPHGFKLQVPSLDTRSTFTLRWLFFFSFDSEVNLRHWTFIREIPVHFHAYIKKYCQDCAFRPVRMYVCAMFLSPSFHPMFFCAKLFFFCKDIQIHIKKGDVYVSVNVIELIMFGYLYENEQFWLVLPHCSMSCHTYREYGLRH